MKGPPLRRAFVRFYCSVSLFKGFSGVVAAGAYYRCLLVLPGGVSSIGLSSFLRQSLQMSICTFTLAQVPVELQSVEKNFLRV